MIKQARSLPFLPVYPSPLHRSKRRPCQVYRRPGVGAYQDERVKVKDPGAVNSLLFVLVGVSRSVIRWTQRWMEPKILPQGSFSEAAAPIDSGRVTYRISTTTDYPLLFDRGASKVANTCAQQGATCPEFSGRGLSETQASQTQTNRFQLTPDPIFFSPLPTCSLPSTIPVKSHGKRAT